MSDDKPKVDVFMPLYWGDYLRDTGDLETIEHGAYMLLIGHYWCTGKPLPNDDRRLARICKMGTKRWRGMRSKIAGFFTVSDGVLVHKRIERELKIAAENKEKRSAKARTAAQARWYNRDDPSMPGAMLEQCPSPSPSIRKEKGPLRGRKKEKAKPLSAGDLQSYVDAWNEILPELGQVKGLSDKRTAHLSTRVREQFGDSLENWRAYLQRIHASAFLMGRLPRSEEHKNWMPDFDWAINPTNCLKILEGRYDNERGSGNGGNDSPGTNDYYRAVSKWNRDGQRAPKPRREDFPK